MILRFVAILVLATGTGPAAAESDPIPPSMWPVMPLSGHDRASTPPARAAADLIRWAAQVHRPASANEADSTELVQHRQLVSDTLFDTYRYEAAYAPAMRAIRLPFRIWLDLAGEPFPQRLVVTELAPVTGRLTWPEPLLDERYAAHRSTIDQLFARRAQFEGRLRESDYDVLQSSIRQFRQLLKTELQQIQIAPGVWQTTDQFLERLSHEARYFGPASP